MQIALDELTVDGSLEAMRLLTSKQVGFDLAITRLGFEHVKLGNKT